MEIVWLPYMTIIADLAKNNRDLTPKLQDVIAEYLSYQSQPPVIMKGKLNAKI